MDFMGPLPISNGHDYLLVVIDCFTSEVHLIPTTTWVTVKEVAWLFVKVGHKGLNLWAISYSKGGCLLELQDCVELDV